MHKQFREIKDHVLEISVEGKVFTASISLHSLILYTLYHSTLRRTIKSRDLVKNNSMAVSSQYIPVFFAIAKRQRRVYSLVVSLYDQFAFHYRQRDVRALAITGPP